MNQLFITLDASLITEDAYTITIVGYSIVFLSLVLLVVIFSSLSRYFQKKEAKKTEAVEVKETEVENEANTSSDEINAAISTALYLYFDEMHDEESGIITIEKRNTNWNAKSHELANSCECFA